MLTDKTIHNSQFIIINQIYLIKIIIFDLNFRKTEKLVFSCTTDTPLIPFDTDIDAQCEGQFDSEFEEIISEIDALDVVDNLPQDLNLDQIVRDMITDEILTPFQDKVNSIINCLDKHKYRVFCCKEYNFLKDLLDKMNFTGPVKCSDLGDFYTSAHKHLTSAEFLLTCMQLFDNESFCDEHKHICFVTSVEIRKFLLEKCSKNYVSQTKQIVHRTVTDASRTRIRYVGGYCVAKIRFKYIKKKNTVRYSNKPSDQQLYEECLIATELLNEMQVDEQYILTESNEPESLYDVSRKQNVNRGLTNISDELFKFFISLSEKTLSIMTTEKLNKHGRDFFENSKLEIMNNEDLLQSFSTVVQSQCMGSVTSRHTEINVLKNVIKIIFYKIVKTFLLIIVAQFRKDVLDLFNIEKKMAHRKQIRVSSKKDSKKSKVEERNVNEIDENNNRRQRKRQKKYLNDTDETIPSDHPSNCDAVTAPEIEPSSSTSEPVPSTSQETPLDIDDNNDNVVCKKCYTIDKETQWIQCDNCSQWLHRSCAGLKHHLKWKKYQKKNAVFTCYECL